MKNFRQCPFCSGECPEEAVDYSCFKEYGGYEHLNDAPTYPKFGCPEHGDFYVDFPMSWQFAFYDLKKMEEIGHKVKKIKQNGIEIFWINKGF